MHNMEKKEIAWSDKQKVNVNKWNGSLRWLYFFFKPSAFYFLQLFLFISSLQLVFPHGWIILLSFVEFIVFISYSSVCFYTYFLL